MNACKLFVIGSVIVSSLPLFATSAISAGVKAPVSSNVLTTPTVKMAQALPDIKLLRAKGESLYSTNCSACHQTAGEGMPGVFPPLAGSKYTNSDPDRHIQIVLHGRSGDITVNGMAFNGTMPSFSSLSNDDIAAIVTYVRTSWGNHGGAVTPDQVKAQR